MNNTIYLVTPTEVKTLVPSINNEIDNTLISNAILLIQNTLVRDTLTQDFYENIIAYSATTANKYLIDNFLKNLIAYGCWQYLAVSLSLQLNSAGLRIKVTDHSQAAESVDIAFYRTYIQNFIDVTRKEMDRYIFENQTLYPLYYSDKWGDTPKKSNFRIGRVGGEGYEYPKTENEYPYWRTVK